MFFKLKKAEMGMGTLIIFIAMILVAAIAAGVLITTTGTLQNKALSTGKATNNEIGTSLVAVELYAENGNDQRVEEFFKVMKLSSGSEPIRFNDILITLNLNNDSADYNYSGLVNCDDTTTTDAGGSYGVNYSIEGTNYKKGYLNKGDVVKICFESPREVSEEETILTKVIPKVGTVLVIEADMPDLMVDRRVYVYPSQ